MSSEQVAVSSVRENQLPTAWLYSEKGV